MWIVLSDQSALSNHGEIARNLIATKIPRSGKMPAILLIRVIREDRDIRLLIAAADKTASASVKRSETQSEK